MNAVAGVIAAPIVAAYGIAVAAATLLLDLITAPFVRFAGGGAADADAPPRSHDASVIVLNYNGEALLAELLPSLEIAVQRAAGQHEVIVVDNGSTDGSVALVRERHPGVELVRLPENRFFIRGNRAGALAARGDVLVFLNNDMRVEPDFLSRLLARFGEPDVFAVTARIEMEGNRVETGRTRAWFRRGSFHFAHVAGEDGGLIPALWAGGGSSAFDRRKFDDLGGFELLYDPCYVEDVSLSYQAWRRGWRVLFEPHSIVHHVHRATSSVVFGHRTTERIDRRNRELFFWRSVTDVRMVLAHALWLPWNVLKDARRTGIVVQLSALARTLPRLPRAWMARLRSRAHARRGDRDVLRVANRVAPTPRGTGGTRARAPVVLSLGRMPARTRPRALDVVEHTVALAHAAKPPAHDLLGLVPRRFWDAYANGVADRIRDVIAETDHDVVLFRDPWVLAAAPAGALDRPAVLQLDLPDAAPSTIERWREQRFVGRLRRRARLTAYDADEERLAELCRAAAGL